MNASSLCSVEQFLKESFDFIVVGGGTAGLVVATRLSENPAVQVGVIEAGVSMLGDPNVEGMVGTTNMYHHPQYDWTFKTIPQTENGGKVHHLIRGKMLGGTSALNFMTYSRPSRHDLDSWSSELNHKGWSWNDMLPYYLKAEGLQPETIRECDQDVCPVQPESHGRQGPIQTSLGPWQAPVQQSLLAAFDEASRLPRTKDAWNGNQLGFYRSLSSVDRTDLPTRSYAANAYLTPVATRPNLKVLTSAHATKVLLRDGKIAIGVEFQNQGRQYEVFCAKEVILSCGAIQSPQLLELSGIGSRETLQTAGVDCKVELPEVGDNLQEHPCSTLVYELVDDEISVDSLFLKSEVFAEHQQLLVDKHDGALSGAVSLMGLLPYRTCVTTAELNQTLSKITIPARSKLNSANKFTPQQQQQQQEIIAAHLARDDSTNLGFVVFPGHFDATAYNNLSKVTPGPPPGLNACFTVIVSAMHPLSRGSVHIASSNPHTHPNIDLGLLTHSVDADVIAAGLAFVDQALQSEHVRYRIKRRFSPPPEVELHDREQAKSFVKERVIQYHHPIGTCAMGRVVDEQLQVKGVECLRVIDASVFPMHISGAIIATVYAIAEKAADMIKEKYKIVLSK